MIDFNLHVTDPNTQFVKNVQLDVGDVLPNWEDSVWPAIWLKNFC